jgi:hypothetical protein
MSSKIMILISILNSAATWRSRVNSTYPDARNHVASGLLAQLSADQASDAVIAALGQYSDAELARESTAAGRLVGFRIFPETLADFVKVVVERIESARAEWKAAFHDGGVVK